MSLTVTNYNIFGHQIQLFVNDTRIKLIYPPENFIPHAYYAASSGNSFPTLRDDLSVPTLGPIGCPETSVENYHYYVHNNSE